MIEDDGDKLVIRHVYIERRMMPLNIYLQDATPRADRARGASNTATRSRNWSHANIFPGDMLYKNFGVTRHGRVVFYDYDEIEYLTDCNFRKVPEPRNEEDEMSGEAWYTVGPHDIFPETYEHVPARRPARARASSWRTTPISSTPLSGKGTRRSILAGYMHDVFPYEARKRFASQHSAAAARAMPQHPPDPSKETAMAESIVIVSAARTPIGGLLGDFSALSAHELGARRDQGRGRARRHRRRRRRAKC